MTTYPNAPERCIAARLIGEEAFVQEFREIVENWSSIEVVHRYDHWFIEFHNLEDIPQDEVVATVQARFAQMLGAIAVATGRSVALQVPNAIEIHGTDGSRGTVIQATTGHLSISVGSFGNERDARIDASAIYDTAAEDYDVAEVTRLLAGEPHWFDLRRAYEMLERIYAKPYQRSMMAKLLGRPQDEMDDLYNCLSRPGHDPKHNDKYPIKLRQFSLKQATEAVREIARQLMTRR